MKISIECSSTSKIALQKLKELQAKEIYEQLRNENIIKNNIVEYSD